MPSIHLLASRHRLAILIASGTLLLAAVGPAAAHHPGADESGRQASLSSALDSSADEMDGWQAGEFDRIADATAVGGSTTNANGTAIDGTTDSNDQAGQLTNGDAKDAGAANGNGSAAGAGFAHAGTSDHGRPHRAPPSDGLPSGQGGPPNG